MAVPRTFPALRHRSLRALLSQERATYVSSCFLKGLRPLVKGKLGKVFKGEAAEAEAGRQERRLEGGETNGELPRDPLMKDYKPL